MPAHNTYFNDEKKEILQFLVSRYNSTKHTAILREEKQKAENYKKCIDFLNKLEYNEFSWRCPFCKNKRLAKATIPNVVLETHNHRIDRHKELMICRCLECGWYAIKGW